MRPIRNIKEMMREIVSYWDNVGHKLIHNFIDSMSRRIQQWVEMEGGLKNSEKMKLF